MNNVDLNVLRPATQWLGASSLPGGCVEGDLVDKAQGGALANGLPQGEHYGIDADTAQHFGLPCGGLIERVPEPLQPRCVTGAYPRAAGPQTWRAHAARHRHQHLGRADHPPRGSSKVAVPDYLDRMAHQRPPR